MEIKMLGMNFSPRNNSNSEELLKVSLGYLQEKYGKDIEHEIINVKDFNVRECLACDVCGKTKDTGEFIPCNIKDDEADIILDKMVKSDGILVATPVYFGLASHIFSRFIMRTRLLRHQDFKLTERAVGIIATAGRRSGGAETTIISSWLPFIRHGCLIVGNGDKSCQFGTMAWAGGRGHVLSDEWGIIQAKDTAERVYTVAKLIKAGQKSLNYKSYMRFCYKSGIRIS